jgi:hypothetical protein
MRKTTPDWGRARPNGSRGDITPIDDGMCAGDADDDLIFHLSGEKFRNYEFRRLMTKAFPASVQKYTISDDR